MADPNLRAVQDLIRASDIQAARLRATGRETTTVTDASVHLAWADALEQLEMFEEALAELNLAVRDDPASVEIKKRLAEVCEDNGRLKQAVKCWQDVIRLEPDQADAYLRLGSLLRESGNPEAAAKVFAAGLKRTGDEVFKALSKGIAPPPEAPQKVTEGPETLRFEETDVVRFCHLFTGREGVYARQWAGKDGKSGYTPVKEPFAPLVARNHLLGNYTVGLYPLRMDNTVKFLAFDIDIPSIETARNISDRRSWEALLRKAHKSAVQIAEAGASLGFSFLLEDSGWKGRHCWLFFQEPVSGAAARRFAFGLLEKISFSEPGLRVEVFPKQALIRGDGLGNLIKLPLGVHRVSGRRSLFLDVAGDPVADQIAVLRAIQPADRDVFLNIARDMPAPKAVAAGARPERTEQEGPEPKDLAKVPTVYEPYDPERDAELQYLLLKCEVLRSIVETINREGRVDREEALVLIHSIGHLKNGPEACNAIFRRAVNAEPSQFLKSRLKGNPVSCPKIRKNLPHITSRVGCDCDFETGSSLYPSPVRHVEAMPTQTAFVGLTIDSMRFEQLLREYMRAKQEFAELRILFERYEKQMKDVFEEAGVEEIKTGQGTLRMSKEKDDQVVFSLTM